MIDMFFVSCYRYRPTETLNSRKTPVKSYSATGINGYLGSSSDVLVRVAGKDTIETRIKFYCDDFELRIGDLIFYENDTYEVIKKPKNTAHRSHHIKTVVKKVDNVKQF